MVVSEILIYPVHGIIDPSGEVRPCFSSFVRLVVAGHPNLCRAGRRAALSQLTPDQQHVLALRFGSGCSLKETAEMMGKQPNAIKQLQFRALTALKRHLGDAH